MSPRGGCPIKKLAERSVTRDTGCIEWTGARVSRGYGAIKSNGRMVGAHRLAYEAANGPIPHGMFVCHRCDNPPCINPEHLFLGTPAENSRDMAAKGRGRGAEYLRPPKLSADQVCDIRRRLSDGALQRVLAEEYGVHQSLISLIKSGRRWGEGR